jgi:hypothetical protein
MREPNEGLRRHKLLTAEIENTIPALYTHENSKPEDVTIAVKFFSPYSGWTWYATEGERREDGDFLFFGYVEGFEGELGYFTLNELATAKFRGVPAVERDCYYSGQTLAEVMS